MALRQIAWCYALGNKLRTLDPLEGIDHLIDKEEMDSIRDLSNIPLKLIDLHASDIGALRSKGSIDEFQQIQLDNTLVRLCASMGKSERIKSTVFPKTYRIFLRFFIYVFIFTLVIAISGVNPVFEVFILLFISLPFFLLKRTAYLMQDPFENRPTDTSVTAIARTIEINLKELINDESVPEPMEATRRFYIM